MINQFRLRPQAVLEFRDSLFPKIPLATFLNLIDGIERRDGGLLLIATTNHPDTLDSAITNRPGRFDVVIEIPRPTRQSILALSDAPGRLCRAPDRPAAPRGPECQRWRPPTSPNPRPSSRRRTTLAGNCMLPP